MRLDVFYLATICSLLKKRRRYLVLFPIQMCGKYELFIVYQSEISR